jgi:hypothetical protein
MRAETGAMRFAGDWRGVFIRGDNAFGYAMALRATLDAPDELRAEIARSSLQGLLDLLLSSDERRPNAETQQMMPFASCVAAIQGGVDHA